MKRTSVVPHDFVFVNSRSGGRRLDNKGVVQSVFGKLFPGQSTNISLRQLRTMQVMHIASKK